MVISKKSMVFPRYQGRGGGGGRSNYFQGRGPFVNGSGREKTCLRRFANSKGADQPAHPRSLISAFVTRVLKSTISKLTISEISTF